MLIIVLFVIPGFLLGLVAQTLILPTGTAERCLGCGIVRIHLRGAEVLARMIDTHPKRGGFMAETTALAKGTKPCHNGEEVGMGERCWDGKSQADPHFSSESPGAPKNPTKAKLRPQEPWPALLRFGARVPVDCKILEGPQHGTGGRDESKTGQCPTLHLLSKTPEG